GKHSAHEQPAMAVCWIFFTAHQCHAKTRHSPFQPFDRRVERNIFRDAAIKHMTALVTVRGVLGTATQLRTEKKIPNPGLRQIALHAFAIELRRKFGVRRRARVDDYLDPVGRHEAQEFFKRVGRMSNSVDGAHPANSLAQAYHRTFVSRREPSPHYAGAFTPAQ